MTRQKRKPKTGHRSQVKHTSLEQAARKAHEEMAGNRAFEELPYTALGPAERQIFTTHGAESRQRAERGVFWDCHGCGRRCDAYGEQLHHAVAAGKEVVVRCACGEQCRGGRQNVQVVSDAVATALIRGMVRGR